MSLVSSVRLSSFPSLSRRLVSLVSLSSISAASHGRMFSSQAAAASSAIMSSASFSSSTLFAPVNPRFFSSSSTSLVAPGTSRLTLSKSEALDQLDSEIRELTLPDDPEIQTYISANQFRMETSDREVKLFRNDDKVNVEVRFAIMPDSDDMGMGQDQQQQQQQQEEQNKNQSGEEQPPKPLKHSFMVQIRTKAAANNFLHINCHADEEGRVVIEHITTDEESCKKMFNPDEKEQPNLDMNMFDANTSKFLNFEDLPDGPAEKVFNLLCDFGVDDRLALFVQQYSYIIRTKQQVEKVRGLADFISAIP